MKFKQQEESQEQPQEKNKLLEMVAATMALNREYQYAITCYRRSHNGDLNLDLCEVNHTIDWDFESLMKLYIALDKTHSYPDIKTDQKAVSDLKELVNLEERYFEALTALGEVGLNEKNIVTVAYTSDMIFRFKHTFCELLHESDSTL